MKHRYVGLTPFAKGYGSFSLYHINLRDPSAEDFDQGGVTPGIVF